MISRRRVNRGSAPVSQQLDGKANALALGFVYLSDSVAKETKNGVPSLRDYKRLRALEDLKKSESNYKVISLSFGFPENQAKAKRHVDAYASERGAIGFAKRFPVSGHLDWVFGEYLRFPSEYATLLYGPSLLKFFRVLLDAKIMSTKTKLILPNLGLLTKSMAADSGLTVLEWKTISASQSDLYLATKEVEKKNPEVMANFNQVSEFSNANLTKQNAFLQIRFRSATDEEIKQTQHNKLHYQDLGGQGQDKRGRWMAQEENKTKTGKRKTGTKKTETKKSKSTETKVKKKTTKGTKSKKKTMKETKSKKKTTTKKPTKKTTKKKTTKNKKSTSTKSKARTKKKKKATKSNKKK